MRETTRWSGEIDVSTVWSVQAELISLIQRPNATEVVVDLSGVTFLDSMGISALLSARAEAADSDVKLLLSGINSRIERLFAVAGLTGLFELA